MSEKEKKPKLPFRLFVTRHYIAVRWVDVLATDEKEACKLARKYCRKTSPDVREEATDNHWQTEDGALKIERIGISGEDGKGQCNMIEVWPDVFAANGKA